MGHITLAEAKAWLGVVEGSEDAQILGFIEAASAAVNRLCSRDFSSGALTETLIGNGSKYLYPNRLPITALTSVVDENGATASCLFESNRIRRNDSATFAYGTRYTVSYTGGYASIPEDVKLAVKMTVQAMRNAAAMDPNLTGENLGGVWSGGFDAQGPGGVPRNARSLLANYIQHYVS